MAPRKAQEPRHSSSEFLHETDAVTDGNQNHCHARIGCDHLIEGTDRRDVFVAALNAYDVAVLEHVVQEYQASRPQAGQHLLVVLGVAVLVGMMNAKSNCSPGGSARRVSRPGPTRSSIRSATPARSHAARAIDVHSTLTSQHSSRPPGPRPRATASAE